MCTLSDTEGRTSPLWRGQDQAVVSDESFATNSDALTAACLTKTYARDGAQWMYRLLTAEVASAMAACIVVTFTL